LTCAPCIDFPSNASNTAIMANLNFAYSSAPIKRVEEIQFGLFSPEEVKKFSIGEILYPETMVCARTLAMQPQMETSWLTCRRMKQSKSLAPLVLVTLVLAPSIVLFSAQPAMRACKNVLAILVTLSCPLPSFTSVWEQSARNVLILANPFFTRFHT